MTTAALAKIKCPEALSWNTLAQVCRLCLRNQCIKFDIFEDDDEAETSSTCDPQNSLHRRISRFYDIQVARSEKLPTKICHDCLFQMEIHTEFRSCVLQNETRLREFAGDLFPKDDPEDAEPEELQFTEQELELATIVDPNQVYVSSCSENDSDSEASSSGGDSASVSDDCDDDEEEEEGEITGIFQEQEENHEEDEEDEAIVLSDDNDTAGGVPGGLKNPLSTSILEQHLLQGLQTNQQVHHHPQGGGGGGGQGQAGGDGDPKTFFLCQFCDLGFRFQENCAEHEKTKHDAAFPFGCVFCAFAGDQRAVLQQHLREVHGQQKPFLCTECKKSFTRRSDLRKHTIVHTGLRPFTCHVCQKSFSRNTNLTKHLRIHAGHKPFMCPKCPRTFVTGSDLVRHCRTHDGVKPFQCSVCPSSFARRDKLINHQNMHIRRGHLGGENHQNSTNHQNNQQNPATATAIPVPILQAPVPQPPPTAMDNGGAGMVIDLDPLTEMRSANGMDMSQRILEAALMRGSLALTTPNHFGTLMNLPEQLFATDTLPATAIDAMNLQMESQPTAMSGGISASSSALDPLPIAPLPPPVPTALPLVSHPVMVTRPFACLTCGKRFPRKGELERHETVHTGAKPFACTMCEKRFSRKDKLVRHKRTHLNEGATNGQQQQQQQQMNFQATEQRPELPQMSFTAALENFRRTEMESRRPVAAQAAAMPVTAPGVSEAKDFVFRPNFYSQINIGEENGGGGGIGEVHDLQGRGEPLALENIKKEL